MKRILSLTAAVLMTAGLAGCGGDERKDVVQGVLSMMDQAASDVANIRKRVDEAVDKSKKDNAPLDFTEAAKAAETLRKETGPFAQKRKAEVEAIRGKLDADAKQAFAEEFKGKVNETFKRLVTEKNKLNEALEKADQIDKQKTDDLRAKIREAEGPFESLARQQD